MTDREKVAHEFAAAIDSTLVNGRRLAWNGAVPPTGATGLVYFDLPDADAPLYEHLEFVGRAAMAGCPERPLTIFVRPRDAIVQFLEVGDQDEHAGVAPDLSWAAMVAVIAARGAK